MILQYGTLRFRQRRQTVLAQRARCRYFIAIQIHQPDVVGHLEVLLVQQKGRGYPDHEGRRREQQLFRATHARG